MRPIIILLLLASMTQGGTAQSVQTAHGLSLSVAFPKKLRINVSYNVHVRSHLNIYKEIALTPIADLKVSLFRHHLGASLLRKFRAPLYSNISLSYGGLISVDRRAPGHEGFVPVYTTMYHNVNNTDYRYNLGFASTQVFQIALTKKGHLKHPLLHQQLGNFMLGVGDFYMTYYNDGGPVLSYFGDQEDRYWTGGLCLGYVFQTRNEAHQIEVAFDKFTGFSNHAFEATGLLYVDNVIYADLEQFSYNTGRLAIKYMNHTLGFGGSANIWNIPFDLQDYLHRDVSNNPYHHKIEKEYFDLEVYKWYAL